MNKVSWILAILLLLATLNSSFFFLAVLKIRWLEWIVFNACAPSNIVFLIGFAWAVGTGNKTVMYLAVLPMFFFGFLGLFVFPWSGMNIVVQASHILMTLNIGWCLVGLFRDRDFKNGALGLLLGIVIFSCFIGFQQNYVAHHQDDFARILIPPKK